MKNKGDGLNQPKNFRPKRYQRSCGNCDYYGSMKFTTCQRCTSITVRKMPGIVFVDWEEKYQYVCDGWKRVE